MVYYAFHPGETPDEHMNNQGPWYPGFTQPTVTEQRTHFGYDRILFKKNRGLLFLLAWRGFFLKKKITLSDFLLEIRKVNRVQCILRNIYLAVAFICCLFNVC